MEFKIWYMFKNLFWEVNPIGIAFWYIVKVIDVLSQKLSDFISSYKRQYKSLRRM